MSDFYVYIFYDPRDEMPFLVGKGKEDRWKQHFSENLENTKNKRKFYKIRKIRSLGLEVIVHFLRNYTEEEAYDVEAMLTKIWGRKGYDKDGILLNIIHGGTGGMKGLPKPKKTKKKMSEAAKLRWQDPEQRKLLNDHKFGNNWGTLAKGKKVSEDQKKKQSATMKKKFEDNPECHPRKGKSMSKDSIEKMRTTKRILWKLICPDKTEVIDTLYNLSRDYHMAPKSLRLGSYNGYTCTQIER